MAAKRTRQEKPARRFKHKNGLWAKKIDGELHFFDPWDDAVYEKWLALTPAQNMTAIVADAKRAVLDIVQQAEHLLQKASEALPLADDPETAASSRPTQQNRLAWASTQACVARLTAVFQGYCDDKSIATAWGIPGLNRPDNWKLTKLWAAVDGLDQVFTETDRGMLPVDLSELGGTIKVIRRRFPSPPAQTDTRDVELERYVAEAESTGNKKRWAHAVKKYNEAHPENPLPGKGRGPRDLARQATRKVRGVKNP